MYKARLMISWKISKHIESNPHSTSSPSRRFCCREKISKTGIFITKIHYFLLTNTWQCVCKRDPLHEISPHVLVMQYRSTIVYVTDVMWWCWGNVGWLLNKLNICLLTNCMEMMYVFNKILIVKQLCTNCECNVLVI